MNEMHSNVETSESDDFSGLSIDERLRREFLIGSVAFGVAIPAGPAFAAADGKKTFTVLLSPRIRMPTYHSTAI